MPCVSSPTDTIDAPIWDDEPPPTTIGVRAHLLGAFRMTVDGCPVTWASVRSRSVVEHLVLAGRPVPRDVLMDRLWPRFEAERARNNLNVALAGARRGL